MPNLTRAFSYYFRIGIAIILIASLFYTVGLSALIQTLMNVSPGWILAAFGMNFLYLLLGAFNLWVVLTVLHRLPFFSFLRSYTSCMVVNFFTPGQVGDSSLVYFLKMYHVPISVGSAAYLVDKLITFCLYCFLAWYASVLLLLQIKTAYFVLIPGVLLISMLLMFYVFEKFSVNRPYIVRLKRYLANTNGQLSILSRHWPTIVANTILSFLKWVIMSLTWTLTFQAYGYRVPWPESGLVPTLASLVGYIPISIGGLGTVEYTGMYLFGLIGIGKSGVLTTFIVMRSIQYFQAFVLYIFFSVRHRN